MKELKGGYEVGDVMVASWGYDQTNIDFYMVVKRTTKTVTLQPLRSDFVESKGFMTNTVVPGEPTDAPPIRRKLYFREDGTPFGCKFAPTYGWIGAWSGRPSTESHYA